MQGMQEDFYFENYRTVEAQCAFIAIALQRFGDELRSAAKTPTNQWLRNVAVYVSAAEKGTLDRVRVPMLSIENVVDVNLELVASLEVQQPVVIEVDVELQEPSLDQSLAAGPGEEDGDGQLSAEEHFDGQWLCPRSQKVFYATILGEMRLWQRPPARGALSTRCAWSA